MSALVNCLTCGACILPGTAERTQGLCKPCARKRKADEIGRTRFGQQYDRVFHDPPLRTALGHGCWVSVEFRVAGPLYGTREAGTVEYLFGERGSIPRVHTPQTLHAWLHEQAAHLQAAAIEQLRDGAAELADREALITKARELAELANEWLRFYLARHPQWAS